MTFVQLDKVRDAADVGFVTIDHHSDSHGPMLRHARVNVKWWRHMVESKTLRKT
jgi:hypothetical protein